MASLSRNIIFQQNNVLGKYRRGDCDPFESARWMFVILHKRWNETNGLSDYFGYRV
jgi:hypothetical protein